MINAVSNDAIGGVIKHLHKLKTKHSNPPDIKAGTVNDLIECLQKVFKDIVDDKYLFLDFKKFRTNRTLRTAMLISLCSFDKDVLKNRDNRQYIASIIVNYFKKELHPDTVNIFEANAIYKCCSAVLEYELPDFGNMTFGKTSTAILTPKISVQDHKQKQAEFREDMSYQSSNLSNLVSAYNTLVITSSLIFTFGATLLSEYSSDDSFEYEWSSWLFQMLISSCIATSFFCTMVVSLIIYEINRYIGLEQVSDAQLYLGETYTARRWSRRAFVLCLIFFVLSLCVLLFDGVSVVLASINSVILLSGIFAVVFVKYQHNI
eukprot:158681_1